MNGRPDNNLRREAEDWLSSNFPRLFDLYQHSDKNNPKNYFDFKELFPIASRALAESEKLLSRLDLKSWEKLREKALPYIAVNDPFRRYQQLWNALDEARGYVFLADQKYEQIELVETTKGKREPQLPDLFATKAGSTAVLEVKTINESNENLSPNAEWKHGATTVRPELSPELKGKLVSTIQQARNQLDAYPYQSDRKIVLLVVRFDHGQKTGGHLYAELDDFVASQNMKDGVEVYHQATL